MLRCFNCHKPTGEDGACRNPRCHEYEISPLDVLSMRDGAVTSADLECLDELWKRTVAREGWRTVRFRIEVIQ